MNEEERSMIEKNEQDNLLDKEVFRREEDLTPISWCHTAKAIVSMGIVAYLFHKRKKAGKTDKSGWEKHW